MLIVVMLSIISVSERHSAQVIILSMPILNTMTLITMAFSIITLGKII